MNHGKKKKLVSETEAETEKSCKLLFQEDGYEIEGDAKDRVAAIIVGYSVLCPHGCYPKGKQISYHICVN